MISLNSFRQLGDYYKTDKIRELDSSCTPYDIINCYDGDYYKEKAFDVLVDRINSANALVNILTIIDGDYYREKCVTTWARKWRMNSSEIIPIMRCADGDYYREKILYTLFSGAIRDVIDIVKFLRVFDGAYYQSKALEFLIKKHEAGYGYLTLELIESILSVFNTDDQSEYQSYKIEALKSLWNYNNFSGRSVILQQPFKVLSLFNWRSAPHAYDIMENHLIKTNDYFPLIESFIRQCEEKTHVNKQTSTDTPASSLSNNFFNGGNGGNVVFSGGNIIASGGSCSVVINGNKTIINGKVIDETPERKFKFFSPSTTTTTTTTTTTNTKKRKTKGLPTSTQSQTEYLADVNEIKQSPSADKCLKCSSAKRSYVSLPCGHPILCAKCILEHCETSDGKLAKCVQCSERIKSVVRMIE
jgi:hypothetical protein